MKEDISVSEYRKLLCGLSGDTPLGYAINIRSQTDRERINEMTVHEKQMRREWQKFISSKQGEHTTQYTMTVTELQNMFKSLAGEG